MTRLRDTIYQAIRYAILSGEFQPGQELSEQALAQRFGVSRSPIRESLLRLEQENLVTVLPRQGYVVNSVSLANIEDLINLRVLIEPACAAAAARADDTAVRTLDRFRGFADQDFELSSYPDVNEAFHRAIAALSGNRRMEAVAVDLLQQYKRVVRMMVSYVSRDSIRRDAIQHEAMIDAIQAHDADRAFRLAREHAEASREHLAEALQRRAAAQ